MSFSLGETLYSIINVTISDDGKSMRLQLKPGVNVYSLMNFVFIDSEKGKPLRNFSEQGDDPEIKKEGSNYYIYLKTPKIKDNQIVFFATDGERTKNRTFFL